MTGVLRAVLAVAVAQGMALHGLHRLADSGHDPWAELLFLLPAYACVVGIPLTAYLLHAQAPARALTFRLVAVGLALATTGAYVGWVNGPVRELRPDSAGSVLLYGSLTLLAWFIALPFLAPGSRRAMTTAGYVALFDEAWRLAITLAFAALFVGLFWGLLSLFVALFKSIGIRWPEDIVFARYFYYPATCAAASFAIGYTEVRPETFRALRRLLLGVLRWLAVLAAGIVLLFLAAIAVEGVGVLWQTRSATTALIGLSLALVTLYNTVYQDGGGSEPLPRAAGWVVRGALVVGPALAALAFWALALRLGQHGVSEDRLYALLVVALLAGYLIGYCIVALAGGRAPFQIRHVNVVMTLVVVAALLLVHSPVLDLKRIAVRGQVARVSRIGDEFDFRYLRHEAGRHGIVALLALTASDTPDIDEGARRALAEANRRQYGPFATREPTPSDLARFRARIETFPRGRPLPEELVERLVAVYGKQRSQLWCIDSGPPCAVLLIDLDGDAQDEAVVLASVQGSVYARLAGGWARVGRLELTPSGQDPETLRKALAEHRWRTVPPTHLGLEIGTARFTFVPEPCEVGGIGCP